MTLVADVDVDAVVAVASRNDISPVTDTRTGTGAGTVVTTATR